MEGWWDYGGTTVEELWDYGGRIVEEWLAPSCDSLSSPPPSI
jgi:hypothetical protein